VDSRFIVADMVVSIVLEERGIVDGADNPILVHSKVVKHIPLAAGITPPSMEEGHIVSVAETNLISRVVTIISPMLVVTAVSRAVEDMPEVARAMLIPVATAEDSEEVATMVAVEAIITINQNLE
jgi:hypothetical protein